MSQTDQILTCPNPKCGNPIPTTHIDPWCSACGQTLGKDIQNQLTELRRASAEAVAVAHAGASTKEDPFAEASNQVHAVATRYFDAYVVARTTIGLGRTIKMAGIVVGGILLGVAVLSGVLALAQATGSRTDVGPLIVVFFGIAFLGAVSGVLVGSLVYLLGILISAMGQVLQSSLDGTVNTSPFLTNEDKARVMSLPVA